VQARERIDIISIGLNYAERATWVAQVGAPLTIHILGAMLVVAYNLWLGMRIVKHADNTLSQNLARAMMTLVIVELLFGLSLALLGFPAFLQPLHLMFAAMIFGVQMTLFGASQHALSTKPSAPQPQ